MPLRLFLDQGEESKCVGLEPSLRRCDSIAKAPAATSQEGAWRLPPDSFLLRCPGQHAKEQDRRWSDEGTGGKAEAARRRATCPPPSAISREERMENCLGGGPFHSDPITFSHI